MSKLAVLGGSPLKTSKFPKWPIFDETESNALDRVLNSGTWGTLGNEVAEFCNNFSKYLGAKHGVAVTNGTVTLEVILRALEIGLGDEVIVPPYTFNATVSSVLFVGATPVFVDIDAATLNIDAEKIEAAITSKTKAIIPVHIGGRCCDMDKIMEVAKKHGLYVIEDAAHAHGSEWKGIRAGSIGDAGSFSFQASKNLTSGEGGFITVNDDKLYEKCWSIHHCGREYNGKIWYEHPIIGTNARMTEWQAAILNAQLTRLDEQIETRMSNADHLNSRLNEIGCVEILKPDSRVTRNSYHLFIFKYKPHQCKELSKDTFVDALNAEGIPSMTGYACLYKQKMLTSPEAKRIISSEISYDNIYLENTERICNEEAVWIPQSVMLGTKKDMDMIADAVIKIYENSDELL